MCSLICVVQIKFKSNGAFLGEWGKPYVHMGKKPLCVSLRKSNLNTSLGSSPGARFSKDPKLFGWHNSLCIFKTKVFRVTKRRSYFNFYSLYNMKRPALQNKRVRVLRLAFRARKVLGYFKKRTPGHICERRTLSISFLTCETKRTWKGQNSSLST